MTNNTLQIILTVMGILTSLGLLAGGIGYLYSKLKSGAKEARAESTDLVTSNDQIKQFYKEQNEDLKNINKVLSDKVETLTREVGEIRGQLNAETRQKEEYLLILKDKNPETKQFMEYMVQAVKDQTTVNTEIVRILGEIHAMAKAEHERDFKITATVTKDQQQ